MNTYLPYETTSQPDAIEKIFCEEFKKLKVNKMTQQESAILIRFMLMREEDASGMYEELMSKKNQQMALGLHILNKRFCEVYKFTIDKRMMIFLGMILQSPGDAVMYGTYFLYFCKKNNKTSITLDDFCMKLFPWGMPTEEELSRVWKLQKVSKQEGKPGTDNLLDYWSAIQSLLLEEKESK